MITSVICILVVAFVTNNVNAMSDAHKEVIHNQMMAIAGECMQDIQLTEDEMAALQAKTMPESENAKCFVACMFKKSGMMDDAGLISKEGALANAEKVFHDAPEEIEVMKEFLHTCKGVNEEAVSDGAKGCDRAKHAFKCMKEHASKFGFDM